MLAQARVVIIGGGIAGCSLLYHLTRLGWRDVALVERNELTAGSTWHAAGNTPHFDTSLAVMRLNKASTDLYARLEAETGQPTGFRPVGSIRLALERDRVDQFRHLAGVARHAGFPFEVIGPNEIVHHFPFLDPAGVLAGAHTPEDGYTDPASTTHALAKGARDAGAKILRHTKVTAVRPRREGGWTVETTGGAIVAGIVVNAAGTWAKEVGAMVGLDLPIVSMEHQYLVTDTIPEVVAHGKPFPLVRDPEASFYLRPEGQGMLFGPYEHGGRPWGVDGIPPDFGQELLPNDLERIAPNIELAMRRVPVLRRAAVKRSVNGPIPHTPDGIALIGPAPGLRDYWLLCGFSVGIAQGGGAGRILAQMIVEGEAEFDPIEFDPRRFGAYATTAYTVERAIECYDRMYALAYPHETWPAGRPARTTPLYHRLKAQGAVFEARFGWERAAWFAPPGTPAEDRPSYRRANWFPHVGSEAKAVRSAVGVLDLSAFSKFEVSGPAAFAFLDRLCANRPPVRTGGIVLSHLLNDHGHVVGEATVWRMSEHRFYVVCAAVAALHHGDWLRRHVPEDGSVVVEDVTDRWGVLVLAGPRSRDVLGRLTRADLRSAAFPWLTGREIVAGRWPVRALRVTYVGELGWELHHRFEYQVPLYDALMEAGREFGIANIGTRAMDSLRLEKGYRAWGSDLTTEVTPFEAGLERLVKLDGRDFIGKSALLDAPRRWACVLATVEAGDADALPNAPALAGEKVVGIVASGGYGHWVGSSLALVYVEPGLAAEGATFDIAILGERRRATVVRSPLHDPENARLRA
jgi:dimethylglycine dehydrogenase